MAAVRLASGPGLTIAAVTCGLHHAHWSPPESERGYRVVLVRRGRFRREVEGRASDLDPSIGYVGLPADEERFAHPAGGDVCTSVNLRPGLWRSLVGEAEQAGRAGRAVHVDARLDLAHRRLLRAARSGDVGYAVVEGLVGLLAAALPREPDPSAGRDGALAERARAAIRAGDPAAAGLLPLAARLDVSPFRLSRAFSRQFGVSLTRYRNRVRVARALDRLEEGAADLAGLAADLGFTDQAHLCRTMRDHLGEPPSVVRRWLA